MSITPDFQVVLESPNQLGSHSLVKLTSVEHTAEHDSAVSNHFSVQVLVDDAGLNSKGKYSSTNLTLPPGGKLNINNFIFSGEYDSAFVAKLSFLIVVETAETFAFASAETGGSNDLNFGVNNFVMPVRLVGTSRRSTLIFRGRIDVTGSGNHG